MRFAARIYGSCWIALFIAACLEFPARPSPRDGAIPSDAPAPPHIVTIAIFDAAGREWSVEEMPRSPRIVVTSSTPLAPEPAFVFLLTGEDDESLAEDLRSAPLRSSTSARIIECDLSIDQTKIELRPTAPLRAGMHLVLAIGAWAQDLGGRRLRTPWTQSLHVAESTSAGAHAVETWPADGATSIGAAISLVGVRFDGRITGLESGLWLEESSGQHVPGVARSASCDEIGWDGDHCAVFVPSHPLAAGVMHFIRSDERLRDATGAAIPPLSASFMTSIEPDDEPPQFLVTPCAIDELSTEIGCVFVDDARVSIRVRATEPVRIRFEVAGHVARTIAPRGEATLEISSLPSDTPFVARVVAADAAENERNATLELRTMPALPLVSITEIRADPIGAEPRQEYVEVWNAGPEPIDLAGFTLSDSPSTIGDMISDSHRLAPGVRALLVPDNFDPEDRGPESRDALVPPGVMLIRLDRSLGAGGLSNSGEPLFLRDSMGRRISAAPAEPTPRPGRCVVRVTGDLRTGARLGFDYDVNGGCTPGR
jgi:hypothetical protein